MKLGIFLIIAMSLIGCNHIEEGTIIEKNHCPMWIQHIHINDMNTIIIHQPRWSITICDTIDGEIVTEDIDIPVDVYEDTYIGDFYKTTK